MPFATLWCCPLAVRVPLENAESWLCSVAFLCPGSLHFWLDISDLDLKEPWILREKDLLPLQNRSVIQVVDLMLMTLNHICAWARLPHPLKGKKHNKKQARGGGGAGGGAGGGKDQVQLSPLELQAQEKEIEAQVKESEIPTPPLSIVPVIEFQDEEPSEVPPSPWADMKKGFLRKTRPHVDPPRSSHARLCQSALPTTITMPFDFWGDLTAAFLAGAEVGKIVNKWWNLRP